MITELFLHAVWGIVWLTVGYLAVRLWERTNGI